MSHTCKHGVTTSCWGRNKTSCRQCAIEQRQDLAKVNDIRIKGLEQQLKEANGKLIISEEEEAKTQECLHVVMGERDNVLAELAKRDALLDECESCFKFFSTVASSSTQKEMAENMQTKIKNRDKP